jgi:hypothetical protein
MIAAAGVRRKALRREAADDRHHREGRDDGDETLA